MNNDSLNPSLNQEVNMVKRERNPFVASLSEKCIENRLQEVLGVNPKTWNDLKNIGVLPKSGTNGEFLVRIFRYYKDKEGVAIAKVEASTKVATSKGKFTDGDSAERFNKIMEAEKLQKIKLDRAREEEVHLKNLQTRSTLLDKSELLELISPLMGNIANILRSAVDDNPELSVVVDKCFISLHSTGLTLCKQADLDSERYVTEMLNREVDLDDLISNSELEL